MHPPIHQLELDQRFRLARQCLHILHACCLPVCVAAAAAVAVCKRGKKIVCGSQSGVLALWSWAYWNDCSDRFPGHPESVDALVKFDEDTIITGSSDGLLRVINILPNKLLGVLGAHADDMPVERLALAGDKAVLASMSHDSCVKLWDLSVLQDEDGADSSEWEEAGSEEAADGVAAEAPAQQQDEAPAPAAAAAGQGETGRRNLAAGAGTDDASDSDSDSDDPQLGSRKRRKREKTAMRKGGGSKQKASGNFFADLL
jgi:ATP-dependent RNA helicase DOB1